MSATPPAPSTSTSTAPSTSTTSTSTSGAHPVRRRIAAAALALLSLGAALAMTASPASAESPGQVDVFAGQGYDSFIRIFWAPPEGVGPGPFSYKIERWETGKVGAQKTWVTTSTRALEDHAVQPGGTYQYRVRATGEQGTGEWSFSYETKLNPLLDPLHKFDGASPFVLRQYQDLLGRKPGFGELNNHVLALQNGTAGPDDVIDQLVDNPARVALRQPVIRLYQAFFERTPDHQGLDYWLNRRADGKKLDDVSNNFASSTEFKNKYGSLSNHDFVELIYTNVLKRTADPAGLAYWTKKLDTKQANRGRVMTQFSESNEFKTKSLGKVVAIDVYDDMLGTAIPAFDLGKWGPHLQNGGTPGEFATWVMLQAAYPAG